MLCEYGCNSLAKYQLTSGKWCCEPRVISCKAHRQMRSDAIKAAYQTHRKSWNKGLTKETDLRIKNAKIWNKGLTKETNAKLKQVSEEYHRKLKDGIIIPSFLGRHHSQETKAKLAKCGGYKPNGGRGKRGWYKGYWCDSSWELAYVIYNLEHRNQISKKYPRI